MNAVRLHVLYERMINSYYRNQTSMLWQTC